MKRRPTQRAPRPHFVGRCERRGPRTAKMAFFVASGFICFVGESRPSSRRYPTPLRCGDDAASRWAVSDIQE